MEIPENAKLYDWPTSTMWFDDSGILCSITKKHLPQTLEEAKASLEEYRRIANGKKFCMLADITEATPATKEVKEFAAAELPKLVTALAMLSRSPLSRMIANLFFSLKPPSYPMKMFKSETDAKQWLKKFLR